MPPDYLAQAGLVTLAFFVQTVAGFGAMFVAVGIGAYFWPVEPWLAVLVPLGLLNTSMILVTDIKLVQWRLLLRQVLPLCVLGFAVGRLVAGRLPARYLLLTLGIFIVAVALKELRPRNEEIARPDRPVLDGAMILLGAIMQSCFATGGPLFVYALARSGTDKTVLRATLFALFILFYASLIVVFYRQGTLGGPTLLTAATLIVPVVLGQRLGNYVHQRIPGVRFRRVVFTGLIGVGAALVARNL